MKAGYFENHPFAKAGFFAFPMFFFIVLMERLFPNSAPEGFNSFIIAFEFAKTPEQVHELLNGLSPAIFKRINTGNYFDFGLMVSYFLFLVFFIRYASEIITRKWVRIMISLSLIILLADFYGNVLLIQLTNIYSPSVSNIELDSILKILHKITLIKWIGFGIFFALLSLLLLKNKLITSAEGLVGVVPFLISLFVFTNNPLAISWFMLSVFLMFFVLIMFSFTFKRDENFDLKNSGNKKKPS